MRVAVICLASALSLTAAACSKKPASQPASGATAAGGGETQPAQASRGSSNIFTPHRKAGLWEMAVDSQGGPGVTMKMQMCVDASTDKDFDWHGPRSASRDCTKSMRPTMGGLTVDSTCRMGKRTIISHGVVSGDLNNTYNVDLTTRMDPAPRGMPTEMKSSIKARWLGPCPPDMKPGHVNVGGVRLGR